MSSARQMTVMTASMRRLCFGNIGATARGPLKLPWRHAFLALVPAQHLGGVRDAGSRLA